MTGRGITDNQAKMVCFFRDIRIDEELGRFGRNEFEDFFLLGEFKTVNLITKNVAICVDT